jgi:4,4'-diaponeurosporenoate glycosyltransferase
MIQMIVEIIIVILGLLANLLLFYRFPRLPIAGIGVSRSVSDIPKAASCVPGEPVAVNRDLPTVSVIIPARNEEKNLPLLLTDLQNQSFKPLEIICVDDDSGDATARIASEFGVRVLSLHDKPSGWTGKTWAAQNGADKASGELLIFLDADVRLGKDGLLRLVLAYTEQKQTISVQPYHAAKRPHEQFSLLFNLIQIAANGAALPKPLSIGLYGPVILIPRTEYDRIGGHEAVRKNIVEDMALGQRLKGAGLPYRLYIGDSGISFRMYADGFKSLYRGWVKNIAAGAAKTPLPLFALVFVWIASMISVPVHAAVFAITGNLPWLLLYALFYVVWVFVLYSLSKKAGHFHPLAVILYPVLMLVLLTVFFISLFKKIFGLKVIWKDRKIGREDKTCG